jgi:NAD(P)-dependent dehydrogenase (short-subunit alcohol dehydrogenase family)
LLDAEKILITGATGKIAFPIARALAAKNEVWGAARLKDPAARERLIGAGIKPVALDISAGKMFVEKADELRAEGFYLGVKGELHGAPNRSRDSSTRETPLGFVGPGFDVRGGIVVIVQRRLVDAGPGLTQLGDRVHRAVPECPHDRVAVLFGHAAIAGECGVSPVVQREVTGRVFGAHAEAVANGTVQTDSHAGLTASAW